MRTRAQIEATSRAGASWYMAGDRIVARVLGNTKMLLDPEDMSLTPHLVMDGFWEAWITAWCLANVGSSDRVLNVGANCGYYSLLFARTAQKVVAVEPQPKMADCIRWSATLNGLGNLRVVEANAGAERSDGVLLKLYDGLTGSAHVTPQYEDGCIRVSEVPTHELMPDATCVFIDAEGHEPYIWAGLAPILSGVRWVCMEWSPIRFQDAAAFVASLREWGDIFAVTHDATERPVSDAELLNSGHGHGSWETIVVRRRA